MRQSPQKLVARAQSAIVNLASRLLATPPPLAARPAEPLPGLIGTSAFVAGNTAPSLQEAPTWPLTESTPAARHAHRHAWFAALTHPQANPELAQQTMLAWVRQDIPGQGPAWEHASDPAARLIHWHIGLSFLGSTASSNLREAMAGSASWHLQHLERRLPPPTGTEHYHGLRRILHFCGLIVGGYTFPAIPGARSAAATGLTGLRYELSQQLFPDGSDRYHSPHWLAETLWAVLIARACTRAQGAPFPAEAEACLARGSRYLMALTGELGTLPPGELPSPFLPTEFPLAWSLWNAALGLGLEQGDPTPQADQDPRLAWLGIPTPQGSFTSPATKNWALWSFRDGGTCAAWMRIKNQPSRFIGNFGSDLSLSWDVGTTPILTRTPTATGCTQVSRARVDGKKSRIEGQSTSNGATWHRDLLLNQARLICTDLQSTPEPLTWQLGPDWILEKTGASDWTGKHPANMTLLIQLTSALSWTLQDTPQGPRLISSPPPAGTPTVSSFEIR